MTCKDCNSHPSRLCAYHARTENLSDSVDAELERLREENRTLKLRLSSISDAWRFRRTPYDSGDIELPAVAATRIHRAVDPEPDRRPWYFTRRTK